MRKCKHGHEGCTGDDWCPGGKEAPRVSRLAQQAAVERIAPEPPYAPYCGYCGDQGCPTPQGCPSCGVGDPRGVFPVDFSLED